MPGSTMRHAGAKFCSYSSAAVAENGLRDRDAGDLRGIGLQIGHELWVTFDTEHVGAGRKARQEQCCVSDVCSHVNHARAMDLQREHDLRQRTAEIGEHGKDPREMV